MDKLLHRGAYAVEEAAIEKEATKNTSIPTFLRWIGITNEFTRSDIIIYITMIIWTAGWSLTFIIGTIYNLTLRELTSEEWTFWWAIMLGIQAIVSVGSAIWFTIGGAGDTLYLFRKLAHFETDASDDGTVPTSSQ